MLEMLWKRSKVAEAAPVTAEAAPVALPVPSPVRPPSIEGVELEEYAALLADVGITTCSDLVRERLRACLRENNLPIFDNRSVVEYLDTQLGSDWEWRGVRECDVDHMGRTENWRTTGKPREVAFAREVYRGAIPTPVLMTIKTIQQAVPEVFFYVSSPKGDDGDPFLAVTNRWIPLYIVERWKEPGFRQR